MGDVSPASAGALVLHAVVIKGFCSAEAAAGASGLPLDVVHEALAGLGGRGLAQERDGRICGWSPTAAGRSEHQALLRGPLAAADPAVALAMYERFTPLNAAFKQVCTDWQVRSVADGTMTPNDHADAAYDRDVIERLGEIHRQASILCGELEPALPRVARYRARLEEALTSLQAGDRDRFTRPLNDSYHDVWMELHQDLLVTLGISRTADDA